jgi:hypothetical protein
VPHLVPAEHDRQLPLLGRTHDIEERPVVLQRLLVEELDPAQGDGKGGPGQLLDLDEVQEVASQLLLRDLVRRPATMLC